MERAEVGLRDCKRPGIVPAWGLQLWGRNVSIKEAVTTSPSLPLHACISFCGACTGQMASLEAWCNQLVFLRTSVELASV